MTEDKIPAKEKDMPEKGKEGYNLRFRRSIDAIKEEYKRLALCLVMLLILIYAIYLLADSIIHISGMDSLPLRESANDVYNNLLK